MEETAHVHSPALKRGVLAQNGPSCTRLEMSGANLTLRTEQAAKHAGLREMEEREDAHRGGAKILREEVQHPGA